MSELRPIETEYKGNKYRSRLEARWALFFDETKIKYVYEQEGYETENGDRYLPDFYLPEFDLYAEVKGSEEQYHTDLRRIKKIMEAKGSPIRRLIILGNIPYSEEAKGIYWYPILFYDPLSYCLSRCYRHITLSDDGECIIPINWRISEQDNVDRKYHTCLITEYEYNGIIHETYSEQELNPIPDEILEPLGDTVEEGSDDRWYTRREEEASEILIAAYRKARQARFEFGESPT